jgi:MoxR-like ATPase
MPNPDIAGERATLDPFFAAIESVLVGQRPLIDRLLIALLTDGHVLLEGVPGLAKTLAVRTVAAALDLQFRRVQFTPDLLPADVIGTQIYNPQSGQFTVKHGPVFTNILLADEINRAPAKVQSALLQAMEERNVTLGENTMPLPKPFFVLATQNPLEQEGTYPLPEAQLDRFMMKVLIDYPSRAEELVVLDRMGSVEASTAVTKTLNTVGLEKLRGVVDRQHVDVKVKNYIVDLVRATRNPAEYKLNVPNLIQTGASPRAILALLRAAKAQAFLSGRGYVTPDDVKQLATDVLRHRIILTYEAEAEEMTADAVVKRILDAMPVP